MEKGWPKNDVFLIPLPAKLDPEIMKRSVEITRKIFRGEEPEKKGKKDVR